MARLLEGKKRNKQLIPMLLGVILLGGMMLLFILQGGSSGIEEFAGAEQESVTTQKQAKSIIDSVRIPQGFFEEGLLGQFNIYEPLSVPDEWGRDNPFTPAAFSESTEQDEAVEVETQEEAPQEDVSEDTSQ